MTPYRELVHACARGGTYKYFFDKKEVIDVWHRLERRYGPVRRNEAFKTMEIESERLIVRATFLMNPITVIRKRLCEGGDIEELHAIVGYSERDDVARH
jgi:hypothetical protein